MKLTTWSLEAVEALQAVAALEPNSGGLVDVRAMLHGTHLLELGDGLGVMAVAPHAHPHGMELELRAAAALTTGRPLSFAGLAAFDTFAVEQGASLASFQTPHRPLAELAQRRGWTLAGFILRKRYGGH